MQTMAAEIGARTPATSKLPAIPPTRVRQQLEPRRRSAGRSQLPRPSIAGPAPRTTTSTLIPALGSGTPYLRVCAWTPPPPPGGDGLTACADRRREGDPFECVRPALPDCPAERTTPWRAVGERPRRDRRPRAEATTGRPESERFERHHSGGPRPARHDDGPVRPHQRTTARFTARGTSAVRKAQPTELGPPKARSSGPSVTSVASHSALARAPSRRALRPARLRGARRPVAASADVRAAVRSEARSATGGGDAHGSRREPSTSSARRARGFTSSASTTSAANPAGQGPHPAHGQLDVSAVQR